MTIGTPELAQLLLRIAVYGGSLFLLIFFFVDRARTRARRGIR